MAHKSFNNYSRYSKYHQHKLMSSTPFVLSDKILVIASVSAFPTQPSKRNDLSVSTYSSNQR